MLPPNSSANELLIGGAIRKKVLAPSVKNSLAWGSPMAKRSAGIDSRVLLPRCDTKSRKARPLVPFWNFRLFKGIAKIPERSNGHLL